MAPLPEGERPWACGFAARGALLRPRVGTGRRGGPTRILASLGCLTWVCDINDVKQSETFDIVPHEGKSGSEGVCTPGNGILRARVRVFGMHFPRWAPRRLCWGTSFTGIILTYIESTKSAKRTAVSGSFFCASLGFHATTNRTDADFTL